MCISVIYLRHILDFTSAQYAMQPSHAYVEGDKKCFRDGFDFQNGHTINHMTTPVLQRSNDINTVIMLHLYL